MPIKGIGEVVYLRFGGQHLGLRTGEGGEHHVH